MLMVLSRVEQLQHLRYALCPKRMDEQQFWTIYFAQVKDLLPPQAFGLAPEPPRPVAASTAAASTSGRPSGSSTAGAGASGGLGAAPSPTTATPAGGGVSSAAKAVAGGSLVGSRSVGEAADAAAGEGTAGAGRLKGHDSAGAAAAPLSPSAAAHLDEDGDVDGDVEDGLDELEDDPELAAYLQVWGNVGVKSMACTAGEELHMSVTRIAAASLGWFWVNVDQQHQSSGQCSMSMSLVLHTHRCTALESRQRHLGKCFSSASTCTSITCLLAPSCWPLALRLHWHLMTLSFPCLSAARLTLAACCTQEALALDDEQGELGSADLGSVADEDLDDYINQLQEEEDGLSKLSTPAKPGIEHSKSP